MEAQEFAGKDGFVWFTGVVEGREDPAMIGRMRVRIIGWHDDKKNLVPTESLPWAQVLMPVTGQRQFSLPKEGEWVMGFFQDGRNGQMPVIMGVYPGIVPEKTSNINQQGFGVDNSKPSASGAPSPVANTPGSPPVGVVGDVKSEPTIPRIARSEMQGTIVNKLNDDLMRACEFKLDVKKNISLKKMVKAQSDTIRDAIRKIIRTLGLSDVTGAFSWALNEMKSLARKVDAIRKQLLQPIIDFQKFIGEYVQQIMELIQWIQSLPAKLLQMLNSCLSSLTKAVKNLLTESFAFQEIDDATSELTEQTESIKSSFVDMLNISETKIQELGGSISVSGSSEILIPTCENDIVLGNTITTEYTSSELNFVPEQNAGLQTP